ncbi:hypothetical protein [Streptomyces chrestomyceticus]|uniref:hypothetical protein n=1 Tax=Streptomyces chrestomyceticus TaxID=68185 RepID=UPI00378B25D2
MAKYLTPQRLYLCGINITETTPINTVVLFARGYGGVASARFMAGIYRENGTRVAASAAQALTMAGQTPGSLPAMSANHVGSTPIKLPSTVNLAPGRYWAAWLMTVGAATDYSFFHVQSEAPVAAANWFIGTPFARAWYINSQGSLPASVNPSAATALADHDIPIMALAVT